MSSIKGIIFDYGGTIDTNGIHWGELIWQEYCNSGIEIERELYREAYVHGERSLAKSPIIEPTDTFRTLLHKKMAIQSAYLREKVNEGILATGKEDEIAERCYGRVLDTLAVSRPIIENIATEYPLVLVSNFYGNMPVVLEEFRLSHLFGTIIESSVVGIRKPDPALFAMGVDALGIESSSTIVIGDSYRKDIFPSSTLGCRSVWLKNICWEEETVIEGYEPTRTIESIEKLPEAIESIYTE